MNRREFLNLMGLGGVGILASPGVWAALTTRVEVDAEPKLMFDGRYPAAADYAARLRKKGISGIDTRGDMVGLWYRDIDAFRLQSGQTMLGCTTWSDFQALRLLIDDARLGRDHRLKCRGHCAQLTLLQLHSSLDWPQELAMRYPPVLPRENRVHLVTWLVSG